MAETAGTKAVQGSEGTQQWHPGNLECAEQFPEFCLHLQGARGVDYHDYGGSQTRASSRTTPTASSPLSSRSSTLSSVSTSPSTASTFSSLDTDTYHHCPQELQHPQHPWTGSPTPPRSRRDKKDLHAARLQRSGSSGVPCLGIKHNTSPSIVRANKRFQRSASSPAEALAAVEPPHDTGLVRMAYAEQQRWITVQQKTFTKWYDAALPQSSCGSVPILIRTGAQAEHEARSTEPRGQGSRGGPQRWCKSRRNEEA